MVKRLPKNCRDWHQDLIRCATARYNSRVRLRRKDYGEWMKAKELLNASNDPIYIQPTGQYKVLFRLRSCLYFMKSSSLLLCHCTGSGCWDSKKDRTQHISVPVRRGKRSSACYPPRRWSTATCWLQRSQSGRNRSAASRAERTYPTNWKHSVGRGPQIPGLRVFRAGLDVHPATSRTTPSAENQPSDFRNARFHGSGNRIRLPYAKKRSVQSDGSAGGQGARSQDQKRRYELYIVPYFHFLLFDFCMLQYLLFDTHCMSGRKLKHSMQSLFKQCTGFTGGNCYSLTRNGLRVCYYLFHVKFSPTANPTYALVRPIGKINSVRLFLRLFFFFSSFLLWDFIRYV